MVNSDEFREAMSRLGASVNLVTTDGPAGRRGLTVSAVCSVTDSPPTLIVCINRANRSHDIVRENGVLCVNILAGRHEALSKTFASNRMSSDDRFAGGEWETLATGSPVLSDAPTALDCRIAGCVEVGTHTIFMCEVERIRMREAENLVYFNRSFHHLHPA
ncbi:flavin reductase [Pseudochelatococcus lubricantis]|uniref:Flavin reductase n=1 Tax=Pseudochelatococcus lubricantis TaxID=1538102 RepID=A0ABX0V3E5_9HYPH|nr:flavin reductase [Pseudochelatococcus lubricantis]NIJ58880.1 flavin reductase [Pseudochelatococcus lubricantis]